MGLKISTFKKGGQTFTDAYAKVSNVRYDNDSKIASFGIKVFVSKDDRNLITEMLNQWVMVVAGTDMVAQCYIKVNTIISQINAQIANLETQITSTVDNDNLKLSMGYQLNQLKSNEILQLDGATEY
jgi:hypothetical protein